MVNILARDAYETIRRAVNTRDEADSLSWLNRVRQYLYNQRGWSSTITWCEIIEQFCDTCHDCSSTFNGFRLPFGFRSLPAAWLNQHPFRIDPRHMAWEPQIFSCRGECITMRDRGWGAVTKRDIIPCGTPDYLIFDSIPCDKGKKVYVSVLSEEGGKWEQTIVLNGTGFQTEFRASMVREIRFLDDPKYSVTLRQRTGSRILSVYRPGEHVPNYRTFEVSDRNCDDQVLLEASRDFVPFVDGYDILETGDLELIFNTAKFLEVKGRADLSADNIKAAALYKSEVDAGIDSGNRNEAAPAWNFRFSPGRLSPVQSRINTL